MSIIHKSVNCNGHQNQNNQNNIFSNKQRGRGYNRRKCANNKVKTTTNDFLLKDDRQLATSRNKRDIHIIHPSLSTIQQPVKKKQKVQTRLVTTNNIMHLNQRQSQSMTNDGDEIQQKPSETKRKEQQLSDSGDDDDLMRDQSFKQTVKDHLDELNRCSHSHCNGGNCKENKKRKPPIPHQRNSSSDSISSSGGVLDVTSRDDNSNNNGREISGGVMNSMRGNVQYGSNQANGSNQINGQNNGDGTNNNANHNNNSNGNINQQNGNNGSMNNGAGGDDGKDEDGDNKMSEEAPNGSPVNEYQCAKCKNLFLLNDPQFKDGLIKQFMVQFICQQCAYDIQHDPNIRTKRYTTMKCECPHCRSFGKLWSGKNAVKNWKTHYNKYHPVQNPDFFKVTAQKLCGHQSCVNVIKNTYRYCKNHQNHQPHNQAAPIVRQVQGDYSFIDGNGDICDARSTMHLIDVNEDLRSDEQKDNMAKNLMAGLKKFSHVNDDYGQGLEGLVDIRMIMAVYHHIPLRDDINKKKREEIHRSELHKQRKYKELINRVMDEQQRRNEKKDRQYKHRQEAASRPQLQNVLDDDDEMEEEEEEKAMQPEDVQVDATLNAGKVIRNETELPYNTNNIARDINDYKYASYETNQQIKDRINRCCKLAKKGKWKKANDALDPGIVADLNKNGNWQKTKDKFPQKAPIQQDHGDIQAKWRLTEEEVLKIIKSINPKSCGGPCGINNALLRWMAERDDTYKIAKMFRFIAKMIVERGLPRKIRDILFFARGLPLAKEKNGIIDFDIRPVLIFDSWLRMVDRIITCNEDPSLIKEAVGEYQVADMKAGCEIASISMEYHQQLMEEITDEALCQSDIINAYNTMDRQLSYDECKVAMPNTINWFAACYGGAITVKFDHHRELKMTNGFVQGFSSSNKFFQMGKKKILKKTEKQMEERHPGQFKINYQTDCSDDGAQSMNYVFVPEYIGLLIDNYGEWNMGIHKDKTNIVLKTNNPLIQRYMKQHLEGYKLNFEGNIEYLSIPHGTKAFICGYIYKHVKKLMIKLKHIEAIKDRQIRTTLYLKFMNLNKVIYILKNTRIYKEWLDKFAEIYDYIVRSITSHINVPEIAKYQIPLSQSRGGLGMRNPRNYYTASKISALNNTIDIIPRFFRFNKLHDGVNRLNEVNKYNKAYANAKRQHQHLIEKYTTELNGQISPDTLILTEKTKHRHILQLIDNKHMRLFNQNGTDHDKARIRSLTTAGATAWLFVPANGFYGQKYTNMEYYVILSLFLGAPLVHERKICNRCGQEMDKYGYHTLSCPSGPLLIQRHNGIRNICVGFAKTAGLRVEIEQRYNREIGGLDLEDTELEDPIGGIPGDLKIFNWYDRLTDKDMFGDVVIGNIFSPSYIMNTRKERLWLAKKKEKEKRDKYGNPRDFVPLAMEVMGAMGVEFKRMLQQMADRIATRKNITYSRMMNRMRIKLTSYLMKKNAEMITASLTM